MKDKPINYRYFPTVPITTSEKEPIQRNITLREHYAGLAMQGLLSKYGMEQTPENIADECISYADALIKELSKQGDKE